MNGKKRILYIEANKDGTVGGSYYSLLYLVKSLNKNKYEPCVLFCQENDLIPEFKKFSNCVYVNDFDPSVSSRAIKFMDKVKWLYRLWAEVIFKQIELRRIINEIQPDMVHLNNGYSSLHEWMLAGYLNNIKVISHDRGTMPPSSIRTRIFVRFLDAIICVSDSFMRNVMVDNLKIRRLFRVHNGIEPGKWDSEGDLAKVQLLHQKLDLNNSNTILGIVGNIIRWKGQHIVIEAMSIVKQSYPDVKCLIIGAVCKGMEDYYEELKALVQKHHLENNIVFVGYTNNVHDYLDLVDIQLHASIEPEPFGRVILEAMAHAKPIIATNGGGVPEIVVDGETGILVPMNDIDSMANAIKLYIKDNKRAVEMGKKGRQRLLEHFTLEKCTRTIEQIYEEVFSGK